MQLETIWPNFFIVGTLKAGTTSLYEYLRQIPQVYMSPLKEPCYFLPESDKVRPDDIKDTRYYLDLFKNAKGYTAIGEASPYYLHNPDSPRLIHNRVPDAKIIIMLRHPVERAFSHYLMHRRGGETLPFIEALKKEINEPHALINQGLYRSYIGPSMYSAAVKRYMDIFGRQRVKVIIFEEFAKNTREAVREVLEFLNITVSEIPESVNDTHNPYHAVRNQTLANLHYYMYTVSGKNQLLRRIVRALPGPVRDGLSNMAVKPAPKPQISSDERAFSEDIFYNDVKDLSTLLGRPLPWKFTTKGTLASS